MSIRCREGYVVSHQPVDQLIATAKYMASQQLVWGNSGNISVRDEDTIFISASGTVLSIIEREEFVPCPLSGQPASGTRRPSKELPMHQAVYAERPDVQCVLHASPFYSTTMACSSIKLQRNTFVESMYYLFDVAEVDYHHPGTQALADAVREKASGTNVIFLKNHGVLVYDLSVREALARLETLEIACRMTLLAQCGGFALNGVANEMVNEFIYHSGYKPVLPRGATR